MRDYGHVELILQELFSGSTVFDTNKNYLESAIK